MYDCSGVLYIICKIPRKSFYILVLCQICPVSTKKVLLSKPAIFHYKKLDQFFPSVMPFSSPFHQTDNFGEFLIISFLTFPTEITTFAKFLT